MERDSFLYEVRRSLQIIAHKFISDEILSKFYYRVFLKKKLNLDNPQTFNEKLQWLKLFYFPFNKNVIDCTDKFKAREYLNSLGYKSLLVPLFGSWENADDIDWINLPNEFVMKCNHGCAYNILCPDKKTFDISKAKSKLNKWLKEDFGDFNIELHYSKIKPRVITCEEYLGDNITDYKFFCFNGKPKFIYVSNNLAHDRDAQMGFFYLNGEKIPLKREDYIDLPSVVLPDFFNEMLDVASKLCEEFPFVRVDFFIANDRYYFAELTFTPGACMMPFKPDKFDHEWGLILDISNEIKKHGKNEKFKYENRNNRTFWQ